MIPLSLLAFSGRDVSVETYGARGDGKTLDTVAIQRAIDAVAKLGGGRVVLRQGRYLSGTLFLKSGVELRIDPGATLLGSASRDDYQKVRWYALVQADGQHDIAVTGGGTIDGQGVALAADVVRRWKAGEYGPTGRAWRPDESLRPEILDFANCRKVRVEGVTLKNAACWVETYDRCSDLTLRKVRVDSKAYWNNDGIDLVDCRRTLVEDCDIDSADDGICLKSNKGGGGCEDLTVRNCRVRSSASAVKFGTASFDGFRHIRIEGIDVRDTFRSAVALEAVDGGGLEDVTVRRIRAVNTGNAFFVRLGHRNAGGPVGHVRRVTIEDVRVEVPAGKPDAGYPIEGPPAREITSPLPSSLVGLPGDPLRDVVVRDVEVTMPGGGKPLPGEVPLREGDYPEFSMFGNLPAWGLYVRDVEGLTLDHVAFRLKSPDPRPAVALDSVRKATLRVTVPGDKEAGVAQSRCDGVRLLTP